jgi:hypothetical protein
VRDDENCYGGNEDHREREGKREYGGDSGKVAVLWRATDLEIF